MNLIDLQTNINKWSTVISSWLRNVGDLYFSSLPKDVKVEIFNDNGDIVQVNIPNMAKVKYNFIEWKKELLLSIEKENETNLSCLTASPLANVNFWQPSNLNRNSFIDNSGYSGVLINGGVGGSFDIVLPYMVVIGDSISEGHPALHGRLHPGTNTYNPNYTSQSGQLSYELAKEYNVPVINQGIGGQTSSQIKARWARDVLAQTFDVGDGRGSNTLEFGGQKPFAVYLHVGINDVFLGENENIIKSNFEFFAQSCKDNGINLIIANIGADSVYDIEKENKARNINEWLSNEFLASYPDVELIDYLKWSTGGTLDYKTLKAGNFADTVHPNISGYKNYANFIFENTKTSLYLKSIALNSRINGPSAFQRISSFYFNNDKYIIGDKNTALIELNSLQNIDNPIYKLEVLDTVAITGTAYTGFASITANMGRKKTNVSVADMTVNKDEIVAAGVIINGLLSGSWSHYGIESVDSSEILTRGEIKVIFSKPVSHLQVNMVGTANDSHLYSPRWTSGIAVNGLITWTINLRRITDSLLATSPQYHNYQIVAYSK